MKALTLMLLTGCAGLGYVKTEFAGAHEDIQACRFDPRRETAVCVDMTSFQLEFNEHLKGLSEQDKQAQLFERDWLEGHNCRSTDYGEYCEGPK